MSLALNARAELPEFLNSCYKMWPIKSGKSRMGLSLELAAWNPGKRTVYLEERI